MMALLDTSALMAYLLGEAEADEVEQLILEPPTGSADCAVSFATWVEVSGRLRAMDLPPGEVDAQVRDARLLPIVTLWPDERVLGNMLIIRSKGYFPFADALIAATAMGFHRLLIHRDEHFDLLEGILAMRNLGRSGE